MGELNKQLQELQARVTQAEKSIAAHHQGISELVSALSSNPFTMDVGAAGMVFYNKAAETFQVLIDLVSDEIYDAYKTITNIKAEAIVKAAGQAVEQTIEQIAKQIEEMIAAQIKQLVAIIDGYIKQLDDLTKDIKDLAKQISEESDPDKKTALIDKQKAKEALKLTVTANLAQAQNTVLGLLGQSGKTIVNQIASFVKSQKDLAKGKSQSLDLTTG